MNTPTSELEQLRRGLTLDERAVIGLLDLQRLKIEQSGLSKASPIYGVFACLHLWQLLTQRMEDEWRNIDYHLVYEYLNELTVRGSIDDYLEAMPPALRGKVSRFVSRVDARFRAVTVHDGGAELAQYWRPLAEGREVRWWWVRKPLSLPPGW